jgi:hypothetical protein
MRKLRFKEFERYSGDPATNTLIVVAHVEINDIGREMVMSKIDGRRQWHGSFHNSITRARGQHANAALLVVTGDKIQIADARNGASSKVAFDASMKNRNRDHSALASSRPFSLPPQQVKMRWAVKAAA